MNVDLSGAKWFKSSLSGGTKECDEVAFLESVWVGIRDSKNPGGSQPANPPRPLRALPAFTARRRYPASRPRKHRPASRICAGG
ncbi:DUF397 domain-containing protein [Nocardia africana]|uniref:DUF397 domain-containing protein n=1 Tax=Nocardia africana TaxID=134964 RepID=UPI000A009364|nr:DUF397 domain-containing protein [Nocardia africana]MCC3313980.1 DUF397 domain-containing protein [Nocardia africana]